MTALLTKSRYLTALNCEKRLWLDTYELVQSGKTSDRRAEDGKRVGELARAQFPDGVLVRTLDTNKAVEETQRLIEQGHDTIFEAAFATDDLAVRVDILKRNGKSWDIIEVKASTKVKDEHCDDAAMQKYTCEAAGLRIKKVYIMHLDPAYRHPDVRPLLMREDVTDLLAEHSELAETEVPNALRVLRSKSAPEQMIGSQCSKDCSHYDRCFADVPKFSIFNIPNLRGNKKDDLIAQKVVAVTELPRSYNMSPTQWRHVDAMSTGGIYIDRDGIRTKLSQLIYPYYFLDFEAYDPAIPIYDGTRPYQHITFQFSCHVMDATGAVQHHEFLHTDITDPRPRLIEALLRCVGPVGSVIMYSTYERTRLNELAEALPEYAPALQGIVARLWDQAEIFKSDYIHPEFFGSYSIKKVLPVLVPSLRYDDLEHVHNGTEAQDVWWQMIHTSDAQEKQQKIEALLAYCGLDTLAMVKLHEAIGILVEDEVSSG
jgi:hypothetical protein